MELPNRDDYEAAFAKAFGKIARKHMHQLREYLGDPPDIENVPLDFWEKMRHETEHAVYDHLFDIGLASAHFHGWDTPEPESVTKAWGDVFRKPAKLASDAAMAAYGWAKERAKDFAEYWTESTRVKLAEKLAETPELPPETTVEEARQANQFIKPEPSGPGENEPPGIDVDEILDKLFGPTRIELNVVNETTRARHALGEAAIEATVGLSDEDRWRCNWRHGHVCEVCEPLDDTPRSEWEVLFPLGPPEPHNRCKCWIDHANRKKSALEHEPRKPAPATIQEKYGLDKLTEAERMELWLNKIGSQKSHRPSKN